MWRHWYGLAQAWGSATYDWTLGQILPGSREEGCQQNLTEALSREDMGLLWGKPYRGRIHIWDYPKGNQAIRTPSPVQELTRDPGELTPVLGLASDCSAQSDCRGLGRFHQGSPSGELNWRRKKAPVSPGEGNGAASVTPASSSRPLTCYPTHGKKLAQRGECRILRMCSVLPSPQLCRCLPKRRRAPTQKTSTGGSRGCQSFQKGKARSQRNHAHMPTTGTLVIHERIFSVLEAQTLKTTFVSSSADRKRLQPEGHGNETAFWKRRNRP